MSAVFAPRSQTIIFDIGARLTKVIGAGEVRLRDLFRTPKEVARLQRTASSVRDCFERPEFVFLMQRLYSMNNLCEGQEIILLTHTTTNRHFYAAVSQFFVYQQTKPSQMSGAVGALMVSGLPSGLVLDVGFHGSRATAIFKMTPLERASRFATSRGVALVLEELRHQILGDNVEVFETNGPLMASLTDDLLEDVLIRGGCVAPPVAERRFRSDGVSVPENDDERQESLDVGVPMMLKQDLVTSKPVAALESLFAPWDDDCEKEQGRSRCKAEIKPGVPLAHLVACTLRACDHVQLPEVLRSIVIVGGLADIPNFKTRLFEEVLAVFMYGEGFAHLKHIVVPQLLKSIVPKNFNPWTSCAAAAVGAAILSKEIK